MGAIVERGRPRKEGSTLVTLQVMVRPEVKAYLEKAAKAQNKTLSEYTREILNYVWRTR